MFKKMTLAALATVSMSAFAQTSTTSWSNDMTWQQQNHHWNAMDPNGMTTWDARNMVVWQSNTALSGGDRYILSNLLDRAPHNVVNALVWGLSRANWQARSYATERMMARYPASTTSYTTSTTNTDGTVTTTTTTSNTGWAMTARPMRFVMDKMAPRDVNYMEAMDILTSGVTSTEATILRTWWMDTATERQRDVIVRLLKDNATLVDVPYYPSTMPRR